MRSWRERILHTSLFEVGGLILVTPLASILTGHGLGEMGQLGVALATCAMVWNLAWNKIFDRWVPTRQRSLKQRIVQSLGFELGLLLLTLPGVAWWLDIGIIEALILDIGFILFFLIYALIFNSTFDRLMIHRLSKKGGGSRQEG